MRHRHNGKYESKTPKGHTTFKHRPIHKHIKNRISKKHRKIFTGLAKQPYEIGGQLDFEKGDLEHTKMHFGSGSELEYEWDPDYETSFHSHISSKGTSIMPSYEDILSMKETNEKEQIIFHKKIALSVYEEDKFNKLNIKTIKNVSNDMQEDYENGMNDVMIYKKYKPIFRDKLGLLMKWHNPYNQINLESESV